MRGVVALFIEKGKKETESLVIMFQGIRMGSGCRIAPNQPDLREEKEGGGAEKSSLVHCGGREKERGGKRETAFLSLTPRS